MYKSKMPPPRPPVYFGIDPGKSDGVIVWSYSSNIGVNCVKWERVVRIERLEKRSVHDLYHQFLDLRRKSTQVFGTMEKAGMHRAKNSAMSSVAGARHNGHLEMGLTAIGAQFDIVQPTKWMNTLGPGRPKDRAERKTWIHDIVVKRHPNMKIHKYAGDAVAIFDYMLAEKGIEIEY